MTFFRQIGLLVYALLSLAGQPVAAATVPAAESSKHHLVMAAYKYSDEATVRNEYQPLVDYLNSQLSNIDIELQVMSMEDLNTAIAVKRVDIVLTNPTHYLFLRQQGLTSGPIATVIRDISGVPLSQLGGVIVTRSNRNDINRLADLANKRIVIASKEHLGAYWAPLYAMYQANVPLPMSSQIVETHNSHESVLTALKLGQADVGFVRTGTLEHLTNSTSLSLSDFKVINVQHVAGFPHLLSTDLFPEWAAFALNHVAQADVRQIASHLYAFQGQSRISGFTIPADYQRIETLARALRLAPFDADPEFKLSDAWRKWSSQAIVLAATLTLLLLLTVALALVLKRARQDRTMLQLLMSSLGEGVLVVNKQAECTFVNAVLLSLTGYTQPQLVDQNICHLFVRSAGVLVEDGYEGGPIVATIQDRQTRSFEARLLLANGQYLPVHLTISAIIEFGEVNGAEVIVQDISKQKETEQRLFRLANFDDMTGFANRRYFTEQLQKNRIQGLRFQQPMSLLMLDLDHFKRINDTYGHAAGDAALVAFASLVQAELQDDDWAGRMGGEEFAILKMDTLSNVMQWAQNLRQVIAQHEVCHDVNCFKFTVSMGVAPLSAKDTSIDQWLAHADRYLYQAKHLGRNRVEGGE